MSALLIIFGLLSGSSVQVETSHEPTYRLCSSSEQNEALQTAPNGRLPEETVCVVFDGKIQFWEVDPESSDGRPFDFGVSEPRN